MSGWIIHINDLTIFLQFYRIVRSFEDVLQILVEQEGFNIVGEQITVEGRKVCDIYKHTIIIAFEIYHAVDYGASSRWNTVLWTTDS